MYQVRNGVLCIHETDGKQYVTRSLSIEESDELISRAKAGDAIWVTHCCMRVKLIEIISQITNRTKE